MMNNKLYFFSKDISWDLIILHNKVMKMNVYI